MPKRQSYLRDSRLLNHLVALISNGDGQFIPRPQFTERACDDSRK